MPRDTAEVILDFAATIGCNAATAATAGQEPLLMMVNNVMNGSGKTVANTC